MTLRCLRLAFLAGLSISPQQSGASFPAAFFTDLFDARTANLLDQEDDPNSNLAPLGFSFSPAGLLFPYHLGVATRLREAGIIRPRTPLAGSSAGALAAVMIGSGIPKERVLEACFRINAEWSMANFRAPLRDLVQRVLDEILPMDAHERLNSRPGRVRIAITQIDWSKPRYPLRPQVIQRFASREDLIEVLLASCCVPFWFTPGPFVMCRGAPSLDGYFAVPTSRFGCPQLPVEREVLVCPFPATQVTRGRGTSRAREVADATANVAEVETKVVPQEEWLSPELDDQGTRPGMRALLRDALVSSEKEVVLNYYELGRRDADLWLRSCTKSRK